MNQSSSAENPLRDAVRRRVESDHLRPPRGQVFMKGHQDQRDRGGPIARLQEMLKEQGLLTDDDIRRDGPGRFNDQTQRGLMALQRELREKGLYKGEIDGRFGPGTADAFARLREQQLEENITRQQGGAAREGGQENSTPHARGNNNQGGELPDGCIAAPGTNLPERPNQSQPSIEEMLRPREGVAPQGGVQNMQGRRVDTNANRDAENRARRQAEGLRLSPQQISPGTDCPPGTVPAPLSPSSRGRANTDTPVL